MISLDPVTQYKEQVPAATANSRSFRVIKSIDDVRTDEIICPASKEAGFKTTCAQCGLCAGVVKKAKNIAIVIH